MAWKEGLARLRDMKHPTVRSHLGEHVSGRSLESRARRALWLQVIDTVDQDGPEVDDTEDWEFHYLGESLPNLNWGDAAEGEFYPRTVSRKRLLEHFQLGYLRTAEKAMKDYFETLEPREIVSKYLEYWIPVSDGDEFLGWVDRDF